MALFACGRLAFDPVGDGIVDTRADCEGYEDALFCDGFEDPNLVAWTLIGAASRVITGAHVGTAALKVETEMSKDTALAVQQAFGSITSGELHVRAWFRVPSGFAAFHMDLLALSSTGEGGIVVLGYRDRLAVYQSTDASAPRSVEGPPLPRDRWICVELRVEVTDPGDLELWIDGSLVASLSQIDVHPSSGYSSIAVGLPWTDEGQPASRVLVDEVIVDTKPIGC
jgi:hypothetical protein